VAVVVAAVAEAAALCVTAAHWVRASKALAGALRVVEGVAVVLLLQQQQQETTCRAPQALAASVGTGVGPAVTQSRGAAHLLGAAGGGIVAVAVVLPEGSTAQVGSTALEGSTAAVWARGTSRRETRGPSTSSSSSGRAPVLHCRRRLSCSTSSSRGVATSSSSSSRVGGMVEAPCSSSQARGVAAWAAMLVGSTGAGEGWVVGVGTMGAGIGGTVAVVVVRV
jgi:hypothetical protein